MEKKWFEGKRSYIVNELSKYKRNKAKDAAAWIIIYGGISAAVAAAFALFVAEGLMTRGHARAM